MSGGEDDKKTVAIRGIDKSLYNKLSAIAREVDKTIGELMNEAIDLFVKVTDGISETVAKVIHEPYVIKNLDTLEISGEELKDLDKAVLFINIDRLYLKDVDDEAIDKIVKIMRVKRFKAEGSFNRVRLLSKLEHVDEIDI